VFYGDLLAALEQAAAATPLIELRRPRTVVDVQQTPDHVRVQCEDGDVVTAPLAINAEGWAGFAGNGATPRNDAPMALVGDVRLDGPAPGAAFERFTRDGPLALLPRPGGNALRSLVWCMPADLAQQRQHAEPDALRAQLQHAIGRRIGSAVSLGTLHAYRLNERMRTEVRSHRCVAVGNAAQTLHPVAGQGFNLALRDCASLVDSLTASPGDIATALADHERRRRADRTTIAAVTRWLPRVFATRFTPVAFARSFGLTALDLVPPLRNELAHLLMFGVRQ
jgi:2-octaprenyl-6-methoxyphenol hydroxylase